MHVAKLLLATLTRDIKEHQYKAYHCRLWINQLMINLTYGRGKGVVVESCRAVSALWSAVECNFVLQWVHFVQHCTAVSALCTAVSALFIAVSALCTAIYCSVHWIQHARKGKTLKVNIVVRAVSTAPNTRI